MRSEAPEADGIKETEGGTGPGMLPVSLNSGGSPRPIRRRGFYRAARRGKLWVFIPPSLTDEKMLSDLKKYGQVFRDKNCHTDTILITWPFEPTQFEIKTPVPIAK